VGDGGVTGDGSLTAEGITVSPATLDFSYDCNQQKSGSFAIANTGTAPKDFTINLPSSDAFVVEETDAGTITGTIAPQGVKVVTVIAQAGSAGDISGNILIHVGDSDFLVRTTGARHGAMLVATPTAVDFGIVHSNTTATQTVTFKNSGDVLVALNATNTLDFTLQDGVVPPGATASVNALMSAGVAGPPLSESANLTTSVALCPGSTKSFTFTGQRSNANVTVNPAKLDFGAIDCGTTASNTASVTISSYDLTQGTAYTAALAKGSASAFKIVSGGSGSLPKASNTGPATAPIMIGLNPAATTPGAVADTLTVTPAGLAPIVVNLTMLVSGAVLLVAPTDLSFNKIGQSLTASFKNSGNAATCLKYTLTTTTPKAWTSETGDPVAAGGANGVGVTFLGQLGAATGTTFTGTVTITSTACSNGTPSAPLCVAPPVISLTGRPRNQ
jgi:hypothetical protein